MARMAAAVTVVLFLRLGDAASHLVVPDVYVSIDKASVRLGEVFELSADIENVSLVPISVSFYQGDELIEVTHASPWKTGPIIARTISSGSVVAYRAVATFDDGTEVESDSAGILVTADKTGQLEFTSPLAYMPERGQWLFVRRINGSDGRLSASIESSTRSMRVSPRSITFDDGDSSLKKIRVSPLDDSTDTGRRNAEIRLTNPSVKNSLGSNARVYIAVFDDDQDLTRLGEFHANLITGIDASSLISFPGSDTGGLANFSRKKNFFYTTGEIIYRGSNVYRATRTGVTGASAPAFFPVIAKFVSSSGPTDVLKISDTSNLSVGMRISERQGQLFDYIKEIVSDSEVVVDGWTADRTEGIAHFSLSTPVPDGSTAWEWLYNVDSAYKEEGFDSPKARQRRVLGSSGAHAQTYYDSGMTAWLTLEYDELLGGVLLTQDERRRIEVYSQYWVANYLALRVGRIKGQWWWYFTEGLFKDFERSSNRYTVPIVSEKDMSKVVEWGDYSRAGPLWGNGGYIQAKFRNLARELSYGFIGVMLGEDAGHIQPDWKIGGISDHYASWYVPMALEQLHFMLSFPDHKSKSTQPFMMAIVVDALNHWLTRERAAGRDPDRFTSNASRPGYSYSFKWRSIGEAIANSCAVFKRTLRYEKHGGGKYFVDGVNDESEKSYILNHDANYSVPNLNSFMSFANIVAAREIITFGAPESGMSGIEHLRHADELFEYGTPQFRELNFMNPGKDGRFNFWSNGAGPFNGKAFNQFYKYNLKYLIERNALREAQ